MMKRRLLYIVMYVVLSLNGLNAETIVRQLIDMGMENVAMAEAGGERFLTWEDNVYRGTSRGLFEVLKQLLTIDGPAQTVHLVVQEEQIPRIEALLYKENIEGYQNGTLTLEEVMRSVTISANTDKSMAVLKGSKRENRSVGKVDVVLYPQLSLVNAWIDKLYGTVINIAPAIEVSLWKGASFTGQVIFPIWNNMKGQMDYIRPGMLVLRQEMRLPHNLFVALSVGNFNANRMGADLSLSYRLDNDRWAFGLNGGLTGSSTFYGGKWELSKWKKISGEAWIRFSEPHYHLDLGMKGIRCIYGDMGVRADCTRHFGEVSVGLFAMYTGGEANGGFHFAIPLPRSKRSKRRAVRVRLPEYFDMEYEAQTGNSYAVERLGRTYETSPEENKSRGYFQPDFLKDRLVQMASESRDNK